MNSQVLATVRSYYESLKKLQEKIRELESDVSYVRLVNVKSCIDSAYVWLNHMTVAIGSIKKEQIGVRYYNKANRVLEQTVDSVKLLSYLRKLVEDPNANDRIMEEHIKEMIPILVSILGAYCRHLIEAERYFTRYEDKKCETEYDYGYHSKITSGIGAEPHLMANIDFASEKADYLETDENAVLVPVYFATDREVMEGAEGERARFKNGRGTNEMRYGVAQVSIPKGHRIGQLERPKIWKLQLGENKKKHVVITRCEVIQFEEWKVAAKALVGEAAKKTALVFVHGFNTTFDRAIQLAGQIGFDMDFDGLIAAYSWSSEGSLRGYLADSDTVELCKKSLNEFLMCIKRDLGIESINLIAHSLGSRAVLNALLMPIEVEKGQLVEELIFAAPDVDAEVFSRDVSSLGLVAKRVTLYASEHDIPLMISKEIRKGYPRAGDGGENILIMNGVETVDASLIGDDVIGLNHTKYAKNRPLLNDISYLIRYSMSAALRHGLRAVRRDELQYWVIKE